MPNDVLTPDALRRAMDTLPQERLAVLPTPLEDCPRFSQALGGPRVLVKRDDLTGLAFGGNKTRKFDFTFGEIRRRGADCIITGAASQSNHARQAAASAAKMGIKAYLILRRDRRSQLVGIQGNLLLDYLLGADVRLTEGDQWKMQRDLVEELRGQGHNPYLIDHYDAILGAVAYAGCALEIYEQSQAMGADPDHIVVASGSGTQAGLVLGAKALGMKARVIGFRPSRGGEDRAVCEHMAGMANEAAELIGIPTRVAADDTENTDAYTGEAYGIITEAGCEAVRLLAQTEGILLDPVYVGKAMSGLMDYVRRGRIRGGETVVFVHTGGTPALFAYRDDLIQSGGYQIRVV